MAWIIWIELSGGANHHGDISGVVIVISHCSVLFVIIYLAVFGGGVRVRT